MAAVLFAPSAMAAETVVYTYDLRGRLIGSAHSGHGDNYDATIAYDHADNRTNVTVVDSTTGNQPSLVAPGSDFEDPENYIVESAESPPSR